MLTLFAEFFFSAIGLIVVPFLIGYGLSYIVTLLLNIVLWMVHLVDHVYLMSGYEGYVPSFFNIFPLVFGLILTAFVLFIVSRDKEYLDEFNIRDGAKYVKKSFISILKKRQ